MSDEHAVELYRRYRPSSFKELYGQKEAIAKLNDMGRRGEIPHVLLLSGPSGVGKTTAARILKTKLKCADIDFTEINAASSRGIDMVRDIERMMGSAPISGACRVWLIDESHALTSDAQQSFLKILEDTPPHVYFMLATTDKQKLKQTIITRCTEIAFKALTEDDLKLLIKSVAESENKQISDIVVSKIAESSEGSARKSLVILHSVIGLPDDKSQLMAIESEKATTTGFQLAQILCRKESSWHDAKKVLQELGDPKDEIERIRQTVLSYAKKILVSSGDPHISKVIDEFSAHFFDSHMAGLINAVWHVYH